MRFSTALIALVASVAEARPFRLDPRQDNAGLAHQIGQIAPTSTSCDASTPDCRTADQVAPLIQASFSKYGITTPNQQAAVLSIIALESGDFKYKHNVYPGRPGQGTVNMQMPNYNLAYAKSIPALAQSVAGVASTDGLADAELNRILGLVTPDEYNFGSGSWFLAQQCGQTVLDALSANFDTGYQAYMACVGIPTPIAADRLAYVERAKTAFGI